jgi:hypothetical protein
MAQVFNDIVIAYITLGTFTEINIKKTFIQGQELQSRGTEIIILIQTYLNFFFGKAVQDKELSRRLEMSSLSNYNTFNISPGKQAYLCSINTILHNL